MKIVRIVFISVLALFFIATLLITLFQRINSSVYINKMNEKIIKKAFTSKIESYSSKATDNYLTINKDYYIIEFKEIQGDFEDIKKGDSIFKDKDSVFFYYKEEWKKNKIYFRC